jgi:putative integral membrane protein (TIGR02587 family)
MLAFQMTPFHEAALIILSLGITYMVVFEAGFSDEQKRLQQRGLFQDPFSETVIAYITSLLVAGVLLWLFHNVQVGDGLRSIFSQMIVLGLPASIGGAAGRLVT